MEFFGKPPEYWLALQERADKLDVSDLISEIATLRSKVSYYESRISQLNEFMQVRLEVRNG